MPTVGRTRKSKMIGAPSVPADVYDSAHRRVEGQCWGSATGSRQGPYRTRNVASAAIQIMRQILVTAIHWDILILLVQVVVDSEDGTCTLANVAREMCVFLVATGRGTVLLATPEVSKSLFAFPRYYGLDVSQVQAGFA